MVSTNWYTDKTEIISVAISDYLNVDQINR